MLLSPAAWVVEWTGTPSGMPNDYDFQSMICLAAMECMIHHMQP